MASRGDLVSSAALIHVIRTVILEELSRERTGTSEQLDRVLYQLKLLILEERAIAKANDKTD
jgi:hypothetical protein